MDEDDAEEMAEAALEMNGPENDTPEAYRNLFKRYQEAALRAHKRRQVKASFIKDKSVHSEADFLTVPEFGRTLEEKVAFNGVPPDLYLNQLNMKRIREIEAENRQIANVLLGREECCGICDTYIQFLSPHDKEQHWRGHRALVHSCGFCGISFTLMNDFERKTHLKTLANTKFSAQDQLKPYQNIEKKIHKPEGDIIIYCTKCGVDLNSFDTAEKVYNHMEKCGPAEPESNVDIFCGKMWT